MKRTLLATGIFLTCLSGAAFASGDAATSDPWWKAPKAPVTAGAGAKTAVAMKKTPGEEIHARLEAILPPGAALSGDPKAGSVKFSIPLDRIEPGATLEKLVKGVTRILLEIEGTHVTVLLPQADEAAAGAAGDALQEVIVSSGVDPEAVSVAPGKAAEVELLFRAP